MASTFASGKALGTPQSCYVNVRQEGTQWSDKPARVHLNIRTPSGNWRYGTRSWLLRLPFPEERTECNRDQLDGKVNLWLSTMRVFADGNEPASGTAFHIGRGYFLTATHVVEGSTTVTLWREETKGVFARFPATIVKSVPEEAGDVTLLWADISGSETLNHAKAAITRLGDGSIDGDQVMTAGFPDGWEQYVAQVSTGDFRGYEAMDIGGVTYWVSDAFSWFGYSGGPLVDACGQLEGISLRLDPDGARSLFLPIGTALDLLDLE